MKPAGATGRVVSSALVLTLSFGIAGCATENGPEDPSVTPDFGPEISDRARAALPEYAGPDDVLKDNQGCYAVFDAGDQWVRPLLDQQGDQICD